MYTTLPSGDVVATRRNAPYISEINPADVPSFLKSFLADASVRSRIDTLQKEYDKSIIAAEGQTGEEKNASLIDAAKYAAEIFQNFPDIRLLEDARDALSQVDESLIVDASDIDFFKRLSTYVEFWYNPTDSFDAAMIPPEIEVYGIPLFNIYENMDIKNIPIGSSIDLIEKGAPVSRKVISVKSVKNYNEEALYLLNELPVINKQVVSRMSLKDLKEYEGILDSFKAIVGIIKDNELNKEQVKNLRQKIKQAIAIQQRNGK